MFCSERRLQISPFTILLLENLAIREDTHNLITRLQIINKHQLGELQNAIKEKGRESDSKKKSRISYCDDSSGIHAAKLHDGGII